MILVSCGHEPHEEPESSVKVLKDKRIELSRGSSRYVLAFNDGYVHETDFGVYSCVEVGDEISLVSKKCSCGNGGSL